METTCSFWEAAVLMVGISAVGATVIAGVTWVVAATISFL